MPKKASLQETHPELAAQWHPTCNVGLTPEQVTAGSNRRVWWLMPYDDPVTGRHYDFEWPAKICSRCNGAGCPYISGHAVWPGYNDLATIRPDIAAQWHPTRNVGLTPEQVTAGSTKKVWWIMPYDDPQTGQHYDFEWRAIICNRCKDIGCPFLTGRSVWPGYNDLATMYPDIAAQWDYARNNGLRPENVLYASLKKVWWRYDYVDPQTGKQFSFSWQSRINDRTVRGSGCPYLTGKAVWPGYNDLTTIRPDIAAQWHPTRNGELLPTMVTCSSAKKVWWLLPYDDPRTGQHYDFEWRAKICSRRDFPGCPFISGQAVWPGYNDLRTTHPELAAQWHPIRNGNLTPEQVTAGCHTKVWWLMPYDDPQTGQHYDFEWQAKVNNRAINGAGCPFLTGNAIWPGFNDLRTTYPELAAQWHPSRNGELTPEMVSAGSSRKVWWLMPYDDPVTGRHYDFEWPATIGNRVSGRNCPYLCGQAVWPGFNDLGTTHPELAAQWHRTKNRLTPEQVGAGCVSHMWWHCDICGHDWRATVQIRSSQGTGCPKCGGRKVV